jgi:hypothetical protein
VTLVLAGPTTVAVRFVDWPKMRVLPTEDWTDTEVTVAPLLLLLHPLRSKQGASAARVK